MKLSFLSPLNQSKDNATTFNIQVDSTRNTKPRRVEVTKRLYRRSVRIFVSASIQHLSSGASQCMMPSFPRAAPEARL